MISILSLPASVRVTMFFFEMIVSAIFLFLIVFGILGKRKKLYLSYLISLFISLIVIITTRTPIVLGQNETVSLCLNFVLIVPSVLGIIMFAKSKKIRFLFDSLMCILNIPIFAFIPYYAYIISVLFMYVVLRAILTLFESLENVKNYPGRLAIKSALDELNDGIAFVGTYGQLTYVNNALNNVFSSLKISSHTKAQNIEKNIIQKARENGRIVSQNTYIVNNKDKSFKFTFSRTPAQISCIDVTIEEKLLQQSEENKLSLEKANSELNLHLDQIDKIQREQELLSIKGHIHDSLAQQLSILHMFILNDNSNDLTELKQMLSNLEITQNDNACEDYLNNLAKLLKMIDVKLVITGKTPAQKELRTFVHKLIKEASTNAIKHGKASEIDVQIVENKKELKINISNNGVIPAKIVFGNGLNNIKAELKKFGGKMHIQTTNNFAIYTTIPKSFIN